MSRTKRDVEQSKILTSVNQTEETESVEEANVLSQVSLKLSSSMKTVANKAEQSYNQYILFMDLFIAKLKS